LKNKELIILRVKHHLTQADLAKICGVSVGTINLIENCKRRGSKEVWQRIQAYFKLDGEQMWKLQNPEI
jgi:DNA-binding XRE family transcriptional regulator